MNPIKHLIFGKLRNWLVVAALFALAVPATASAASHFFYPAANGHLQTGMMVSLSTNPGIVEGASNANSKKLVGVIIPSDGTSLSDVKPGQITVATDSVAQTFVSTIGGNIKVGDKIATSVVAGAGQRTTQSGWIVGVAQASFDPKTKGAIKQTLKDQAGKPKDVYIGAIPVLVKVSYYVDPKKEVSSSASIPLAVQKAANAIAGRPVSTIAIVVSFILLVLTFGIAGFLINGSARGSFVAIGRNPLTKSVVIRGLLLTLLIAFGIIGAGLLASYILLRLL